MHHIDGLNYAHDFLLLDDYYVFHMTPFSAYSLKALLLVYSGWSSPGELLSYDSSLPSQFVVVPRRSTAKHQEIRFFDTEPFHVRKLIQFRRQYCTLIVVVVVVVILDFPFW